MQTLQQIGAVTSLSIKSLPERWATSLVIILSIAGVVAVLLGVLTMSESLLRTMTGASQPDRAIVLSKNSRSEGGSALSRSAVLTIQAAPGLKNNDAGKAIASPEALAVIAARQKSDNARTEVVLRGITPIGMDLRPETKLIAGRHIQPGLHELLVGKAAQLQFKGFELGERVSIRGTRWTIVGVFAANGNARESELLADAETVLSAYQRSVFQAVTVQLENPSTFTTFKDALTTDPSLSVEVLREAEYYSQQTEFLNKLLSVIAYVVGTIMAAGAMAGAVNCMYSAVSARSVEIATLRALGFGPADVVISVLTEALLLALIGAVIGAAIVWIVLSGSAFSTQVGAGQIVSQLRISGDLIGIGIIWACTIGMIGGFFPALRAARIPVATALRGI